MKNLKRKHLAWVLFVALMASCQKEKSEVRHTERLQVCDFKQPSFNLAKREETPELVSASRRKFPKTNDSGGTTGGTDGGTTGGTDGGTTGGTDGGTTGGTGGTTGGTDSGTSGGGSTTYASVILLDFDGQNVNNAYWNNGNTISARYSGMNATEIAATIARVQEDYSPFSVTVTADENVYNQASPSRRIRVIVTESYEWFGQAGGVAYLGSFAWGTETPAWVFSSLLGYSAKNVAEAISHEAGHTLGLYHQAEYSGGSKVSDYHAGTGSGETGWAPIMGVGYYQNLSIWHNGTNSNGQGQDDLSIINSLIPFKGDDFGNSVSAAAPLGSYRTGLINTTNDVDVFSVDGAINSISLRSNGNVDLQYTIYNSSGQAIATGNDVSLLSTGSNPYLPYGRYYIGVTSVANSYSTTYGMVGTYSVSVQ